MTTLIILVVSGSLILGAVWGIYWPLSRKVEGFLVALAGGALMVSALLELIDPALEGGDIWWPLGMVLTGAVTFSTLDYLVDMKWGSDSGAGLLTAITLDGLPENLALGVALIGADPLSMAALAGSILLSNVPEAAGGAKAMAKVNGSKVKILLLWAGVAVLLSASALLGNYFLTDVSDGVLNNIKCFAAGAVVASLALEVFPKAFKDDAFLSGFATAIGLIMALLLNKLGE